MEANKNASYEEVVKDLQRTCGAESRTSDTAVKDRGFTSRQNLPQDVGIVLKSSIDCAETANIGLYASGDGALCTPRLELIDVTVSYPNGVTPIEHFNLAVHPGEIIGLLGSSGSGKSTLLRAIAGLEPISAGTLRIDGCDAASIPTHQRSVGMVFQDGQLFPHRTVARNISYGLEMQNTPRSERKARVRELLELVELPGYEQRSITTLSGGQAQRVALARSLAPKPQVLLLDEPLSALDRALRENLAHQLRTILRRTHTTAIYVSHDEEEARIVTDRIVRLGSCDI